MPRQPPPRLVSRRTFLALAGVAALSSRLTGASNAGRLRIGQVGTAHAHAAGKMQALRAQPERWEVVGLVEPDAARRERLAPTESFRGVPLLTEAQLLATEGLQAVAIETRVEDACATALRALRAGKHVHLDKPGALAHAEFSTMRREAEARGLTVQMGYMLRYHPAVEFAVGFARAGGLGEITGIDASMNKLSAPAERAEIGALPGGAMFELGCHPIDLIVALLGRPSAVRAVGTPVGADGVKDNQVAVLEYPRAAAVVRTNISDPFGVSRRHFTITGTEGTCELLPLESGTVQLALRRDHGPHRRGSHTLSLPRAGGRYDAEFVDLARVIRGEKSLAWSADHDIAVHATLLQAAGLPPH